jgi:Uma2 family endonuclease
MTTTASIATGTAANPEMGLANARPAETKAPRKRPRDTRITVYQWGEIDDDLGLELVRGRLERKPDVPLWHEILLCRLIELLGAHVRRHGLGELASSNGKIKLSKYRGRKPDVFFVPTALFPLIGRNLFHGASPLVVEVISPGKENEDRDRKTKCREYARLGVGEYWIVDFPNRRIEVLRLEEPDPAQAGEGGKGRKARRYREAEVVGGDAVWRPAMFPGLEIPLSQVWPATEGNPELE